MKSRRLVSGILAIFLMISLCVVPVSAQEVPVSLQQAAVTLREGIKNWENFVTVTFNVDQSAFDGTQESADALANQVLDLALAHTGVPDEGDYLRFNLGYMAPDSVNFVKQNEDWQFTITYYFAYWTTPEQEAETDRAIEALVAELGLKGDLSEYEKIFAIYQYITGNVAYDYERRDANEKEEGYYPQIWSTYAAAVEKTAVCQGYATLFYRLALEAGLDSRVMTGLGYTVDGTESHAWNIVKLDGFYYYMDATWDAQEHNYFWFLNSDCEFLGQHVLDAEYLTEEFAQAYPIAPVAYETPFVTNQDFAYRVVNGAAVIFGYEGTDSHVVVPATVDGYPVHTIDQCSFYNNGHIVSLTFSEGIQYIETSAILDCKNLKEIHLPSTVDYTASKDPDDKCNVSCGAFNCPSVEIITVPEENPNLVVVDGVLYSKDMTFLRYYPAGDTRETFEIPEGVLCIGAFAFSDNEHIKEIKMPDTVRRLQMGSFEGCSNLHTINISTSCNWIDQWVFSETAIESIHIPASVEMLAGGSFGYKSKLSKITVDPGNPYYYMMDDVLYCHYTEKNSDTCHMDALGDWVVKYPAVNDATTFTIPDGIMGIDQDAFASCENLREIILPDSLKSIYQEAFWDCTNLTKVDLPENLRKIWNGAFEGCTSLVELVIPPSVEYLGYYIVGQNHNLENIVFLGDAPEMSDQTFAYLTLDVYYPAGNTTWDKVKQMYAYENGVQWIESCEMHQFTNTSTEPTCTKFGYAAQTCSVCGLVTITGDLIPAKGHDWAVDHVKDPSCEVDGYTAYKCSVCKEWTQGDWIDALGHSYDENGICTRCVEDANEFGFVGPNVNTIILFVLGIPIGIIVIALIVKAIRKSKKK